jgi:hypothetical protein
MAGRSDNDPKSTFRWAKIAGYESHETLEETIERRKQQKSFRKPKPEIRLSWLRRWYEACQDHHHDCCNEPYSDALAEHIDQLVVVDVQAGCLVEIMPLLLGDIQVGFIAIHEPFDHDTVDG